MGEPPVPEAAAPSGLTLKEESFARALVDTGNRSLAYRRAYLPAVTAKPSSIWACASEVASRPHVQAFFRTLQESAAAQAVANKAMLIKFLWDRILCDRRELMNQYTYNCRYCYGERGLYQWKDEMEFALAFAATLDANAERLQAKQKQIALPSDEGGYGFDAHRAPNVTCEHTLCMGHGTSKTVFADTTTLTGAAALCYEGMEVTSQGVKMKIAHRATDIQLLSKLLGWSVDKVEGAITGANGRSAGLPPEAYDIPSTSSPEEASRKYLALVM